MTTGRDHSVCVCELVPEPCVPGGYGCVSHVRSVFTIPALMLSCQTHVRGVLNIRASGTSDNCGVPTLFPVHDSIFFDAELSGVMVMQVLMQVCIYCPSGCPCCSLSSCLRSCVELHLFCENRCKFQPVCAECVEMKQTSGWSLKRILETQGTRTSFSKRPIN